MLEDWDEETVARMLEWLYTEDYKIQFPSHCQAHNTIAEESVEETHAGQRSESWSVMGDSTSGGDPLEKLQDPAGPETSIGDHEELLPGLQPINNKVEHQTRLKERATRRNENTAPFAPFEFPLVDLGCNDPYGRKLARRPNVNGPLFEHPLTPFSDLSFHGFHYRDTPRKPTYVEELHYWLGRSILAPEVCDYEVPLMAHTKLYALANYMLLPQLQTLTYHRVQATLASMRRLVRNTPAVANLALVAQYVYANTGALKNQKEPLRRLVSTFIGSNFAEFIGEGVDELLEQGGDFVVDVCSKSRLQMHRKSTAEDRRKDVDRAEKKKSKVEQLLSDGIETQERGKCYLRRCEKHSHVQSEDHAASFGPGAIDEFSVI